eukprot:6211831-Pleurochrysis_carterae.AAC.3
MRVFPLSLTAASAISTLQVVAIAQGLMTALVKYRFLRELIVVDDAHKAWRHCYVALFETTKQPSCRFIHGPSPSQAPRPGEKQNCNANG